MTRVPKNFRIEKQLLKDVEKYCIDIEIKRNIFIEEALKEYLKRSKNEI